MEIGRSKRYASPLALILFDIDHFKHVNDNYGHATGDEVLKNLVRFCQSNIREIDVLGRFGGEEFLILMPSTDEDAAFIAAERLRQGIESIACTSYHSDEVRITISLGVSVLYPMPDMDAYQEMKRMLNQADKAMYLAKQSGRNQAHLALKG